jgi:hypothetical protein
VVVGETRAYSQQAITRAVRLIAAGARFIATNPDPTGPSPAGPQPATGAVAALVSKATGVRPYFVGKPNPLMMREALRAIDAHSESTVMIGDRMDTDVVAGIEAGLQTISVACRGRPAGRQPVGASSVRPPIMWAHRHRTGSQRSEPRTPVSDPGTSYSIALSTGGLGGPRWSRRDPEGDPAVDHTARTPSSSLRCAFYPMRTGRRPAPPRPRPGRPG